MDKFNRIKEGITSQLKLNKKNMAILKSSNENK